LSLSTSLQNEPARAYGVIAECIARVASGDLRVVIERKYALADAVKAHTHVEDRSVFGRIVMLPRGI
jgi:NADPH2:quinone reductase